MCEKSMWHLEGEQQLFLFKYFV